MEQTTVYHNIVTFRPYGQEAALLLKLEEDWVLTPGVQPNVVRALVSYREFDKLPADLSDLTGEVGFWFHAKPGDVGANGDPAAPDLKLSKISLVDVEPVELARPAEPPFQLRVAEYRLFLADRREQFLWPRGGHLDVGEINAEPLSFSGATDKNGNPTRTVQWVVRQCLKAMKVDGEVDVPHAMSDLPRLFNLQWRGNHAPTELAKILEQYGYVFMVRTDGECRMQRIGDGNLPELDASTLLPETVIPNLDRRGKIVVFLSHPNPVVETRTLWGPNDDADLYFVAQDLDGTWKKLKDTQWFTVVGPEQAVRTGFAAVPEAYRRRVASQTYRCLGFSPKVYGPTPILRHVFNKPTGSTPARTPISVQALMAVRHVVFGLHGEAREDGLWANSTDYATAHVTHLLGDGAVLMTHERLGKVQGGPVPDPEAAFVALSDGDLQARISYEAMEKVPPDGQEAGATTAWRYKYFAVGFQSALGKIAKLSEADLKNAVDDPATMIVARPELKLLRVDDQDANRVDLEATAQDLAPRYVRNSGTPTKLLRAKGFVFGNLSGLVAEAIWSQEKVSTTFKVNTWWQPHGRYLTRSRKEAGKESPPGTGPEAHPQQSQTQPQRSAYGASGTTQPAVPLQPAIATSPAINEYLLNIGGNSAGAGFYVCAALVPPSTDIDPTQDLTSASLGATPAGIAKAVAINLQEMGAGTHDLAANTFALGLLWKTNGDGTAIFIITRVLTEDC